MQRFKPRCSGMVQDGKTKRKMFCWLDIVIATEHSSETEDCFTLIADRHVLGPNVPTYVLALFLDFAVWKSYGYQIIITKSVEPEIFFYTE